MIEVTRLNGTKFYVNPHQIEFLEATPDTIASFLTGKKLVLADPIPEIVDRIVQYRQRIGYPFGEANGE